MSVVWMYVWHALLVDECAYTSPCQHQSLHARQIARGYFNNNYGGKEQGYLAAELFAILRMQAGAPHKAPQVHLWDCCFSALPSF